MAPRKWEWYVRGYYHSDVKWPKQPNDLAIEIGGVTREALDMDIAVLKNRKDIGQLFKEIFIDEDYQFDLEDPKLIVDCGSNIGTTLLYFHELYPRARFTGFEPSPVNFKKLETNCSKFGIPVYLFNSALSNENGTLDFYDHNDVPLKYL